MPRISQAFTLDWNPQRILYHLFYKLLSLVWRLLDIILHLPVRLRRLIDHIGAGGHWIADRLRQPNYPLQMLERIGFWWLELVLLLLDILGLSELYESCCDWLKPNTRSLKDWEIALARSVFGNSINYRRVRVDTGAVLGPLQRQVCYVSFYTVNSWGHMNNSLLLHELTHVWQYQRMGIVYMPRAIRAMFSEQGYNYGGVDRLYEMKQQGSKLTDFNLEQQADIIADYYRVANGYQPTWGNGSRVDLPVYEYFVRQLQEHA